MAPNSAMKVPVLSILLPSLIPSDKPRSCPLRLHPWGGEGRGGGREELVIGKKKKKKNLSKNLTNVSKPERQQFMNLNKKRPEAVCRLKPPRSSCFSAFCVQVELSSEVTDWLQL